MLLFGANLIIFASNVGTVSPSLLSTLCSCDLVPLPPYPPFLFLLFRQFLFLRLMQKKKRNVDGIINCSCYWRSAKTAATIHALSFAGVTAGAATARASMSNAGRRNVGGRCRACCRHVGGGAPGDGNVGGGGSAGHGNVGCCDGNVGGLCSLYSAAGGGSRIVVGETRGFLLLGRCEVLISLIKIGALIP